MAEPARAGVVLPGSTERRSEMEGTSTDMQEECAKDGIRKRGRMRVAKERCSVRQRRSWRRTFNVAVRTLEADAVRGRVAGRGSQVAGGREVCATETGSDGGSGVRGG